MHSFYALYAKSACPELVLATLYSLNEVKVQTAPYNFCFDNKLNTPTG